MAVLSLREAAQQARTSKSTILRAIQSGRLSAGRTEGGGYAIDPAELFRVYPPKAPTVALERPAHQSAGQDAPPDATLTPIGPDVVVRLAVAEAEITALKDMVAELRHARDAWQAQAERLALPAPGGVSERRPWWRRAWG